MNLRLQHSEALWARASTKAIGEATLTSTKLFKRMSASEASHTFLLMDLLTGVTLGLAEKRSQRSFLGNSWKAGRFLELKCGSGNLYALSCVRSWDVDLILQDGEEDSCTAQRVGLLLPSLHTDVTRISSWEFKWRVPRGELGNQTLTCWDADPLLSLAEEIQKSGSSTKDGKNTKPWLRASSIGILVKTFIHLSQYFQESL